MLAGLRIIAFMFDVPLRDTYGMHKYISHSSYISSLRLVNCHYLASRGYRGYCNYRKSVVAQLLFPQQ